MKLEKEEELHKELSQLAQKKQLDMTNDVENLLQEQEQKRIVLLELLPDDEDTISYSSDSHSIDIPGLNISSKHKHMAINAKALMDIYKKYAESNSLNTKLEAEKKENSKSSSPTESIVSQKPFKVKCSVTQGFQCSSCSLKESQSRRKEQTIRMLFYKKYPKYSREHPEISYRTSNSPPNVQAQEARQRKKKLMMRLKEQQLFSAFREQFLREERLAEEGRSQQVQV